MPIDKIFSIFKVQALCTMQCIFLLQVLAMEPKNLEATKLKILQLVCRGSQYEEAAVALRRFFVELERAEPKVHLSNFEI